VSTARRDESDIHSSRWPSATASESRRPSGASCVSSRVAADRQTAPGPAIAGTGPEARQVCVTCNDEVAAICAKEPDRFAYFASLPSFFDVEGCLAEIERAFTLEPAPQGFVIMTTCASRPAPRLTGQMAMR